MRNAVGKTDGRKTTSGKTLPQRESTLGDQQVREEIESFLRALISYPESFSRRPGISFEQHRSLIAQVSAEKSRNDLTDC